MELKTPTDEVNDLTNEIAYLALGQPNVTVENYGRYDTKVSGRCAHIIRKAIEENHQYKVRFDLNQYAFVVDWNA